MCNDISPDVCGHVCIDFASSASTDSAWLRSGQAVADQALGLTASGLSYATTSWLLCAGEKYRGWSIAVAQGLCLMDVKYPMHGDPGVLCHPDIEHDSFGRPLVGSTTGEE